jgi:microcystin-dependent protein
MSEAFVGSLMLVPYNFAPKNWALCQGQLLNISSNTPLFSLLGTIYGGNGTSNFALPDLRGRHAIDQGQGPGLATYVIGQAGGTATETLTTNTVPPHNHPVNAGLAANANSPAGAGLGDALIYIPAPAPLVQLNATAVTPYPGSGGPHTNLMPFTTLNWIICLVGIFPRRP